MGSSRYVGRVGGLAVALGVGAAVVGWGSGNAWADDDAGSPSSSSSDSSASTPAKEAPKPDKPDSTSPAAGVGGDKDEADSASDPAGEIAADTSASDANAATPMKVGQRGTTKRASERVRRAAAQIGAAAQNSAAVAKDSSSSAEAETSSVRTEPAPVNVPPTPTVVVIPVEVVVPDVVVPPPAPKKPDVAGAAEVIETAVGRLTSAVSAVFNPSASYTPEAPSAQPQAWALLAAARREFDVKATTAEALAPVQTTGQPQIAATETPDVQAPLVQNSITYTGPPTLLDQITVFTLRVMQTVSRIFGVDIYGSIGKLMASSSPPFFVKFGLDVRRTEYEVAPGDVWKVWEFHPPEPSGKTVIAVHGGGFILQPNLLHWIDYSNMARETGATVVVPMYPLATTPSGTAVTVVPGMADFISDQIAEHGAENISIYADSAGPSLALGAVRELILRGEEVPASMVLISFAPDASLSNPDIKKIKDPIVDVNNMDFYTTVNHWGDGLESTDPMLSPLFVESEVFQKLPPTTIYVGDLEFMLPDTLLYHQRAVAEGVPISLVVGRGQIHDWPLAGLPINSQAPKVRKSIYRQLGLIT